MNKVRKVICMGDNEDYSPHTGESRMYHGEIAYSIGDYLGVTGENEITSMVENPDGDIIVWVEGMNYPYMKIKEHSVNRIFYE